MTDSPRDYHLMHMVVQLLKREDATDEEVYSIGLRLIAAAAKPGDSKVSA